jgi:ankyrin repeat protein
MHNYLKGLCVNETRILRWENGADLDLSPTPVIPNMLIDLEERVSIEFTVQHITSPSDYQIFGAWREGNFSLVLDMVVDHKGVNAVDEWGQTVLMHAVQAGSMDIVAALLNTRMPKVDVNIAKSNGFTALIYAVDLASTSILKALLRRGADPNCQLRVGVRSLFSVCAAVFAVAISSKVNMSLIFLGQ